MSEHTASFKVYYEDTDSLGVVYYANYFKFLERGRAEFLEASGRSVAQWNADGYLFVVHAVNARFRRSARLGEVLDVITGVELVNDFKARFHQRIEVGGVKILDATIDVGCLDPHGRLQRMPASLGD